MYCSWRFCSEFELLWSGVLALRLLFSHPDLGPVMTELMAGMIEGIISKIDHNSRLENMQHFIIHNSLKKK